MGKTKSFIFTFLSLIFFILSVFVVSAATADASFSITNTPPPNVANLTVQDSYVGPNCTVTGATYDEFGDDLNITTHMLNATINVSATNDGEGDTVYTLFCLGTDPDKLNLITNTSILGSSEAVDADVQAVDGACDVIDLFNISEDSENSIEMFTRVTDNITLLDNYTDANVTPHYNVTEYYGVVQRYDNATQLNLSDIHEFNITLVNERVYWDFDGTDPKRAGASGFVLLKMGESFVPTANETHNQTPDMDWDDFINFEDGNGADKCPEDPVTVRIIVANDSSFTDVWFDNSTPTDIRENNYTYWNWTNGTIDLLFWNESEVDNDTNADNSFDGSLGGGWSNSTFYVRINATDGHPGPDTATDAHGGDSNDGDFEFQLTNYIPSLPVNMSLNSSDSDHTLNSTHNQSPALYWFGTFDREDDTIIYTVSAGTAEGLQDIMPETTVTNIDTNFSTNFFSHVLPYGTDGVNSGEGEWANDTIWVTIRLNDTASGHFRNGTNFSSTFELYDSLPNVTEVAIHDEFSAGGYTVCLGDNTTTAGTNCQISPIAGSNSTLGVRVNFTDDDGDCEQSETYGVNGTPSTSYFNICVNASGHQDCNQGIANWSLMLDNVTNVTSTDCVFTFNENVSDLNGTLPFWLAGGVYFFNVNVSSQSGYTRGVEVTDNDNSSLGTHGGRFSISEISAVNYTGSITPGLSSGGNILGEFNDGDNKYVMSNAGNNIVMIQWSSTNFTLAGSNKNWSLSNSPEGDANDEGNDDFVIDDDPTFGDNIDTDGSGNNLTYTIIENGPGESTANESANGYFNYSTGLELCWEDTCDPDVSEPHGDTVIVGEFYDDWNQSMPTYFHIRPPTGLTAGTYSATITYTVEDYDEALYDIY